MLKRRGLSADLGGWIALLLLLVPGAISAAEVEAESEAPESESRVVATIGGDPVHEIEIDRAIALGLAAPASPLATGEAPGVEAYRRQVLDQVIDARLRARVVQSLSMDELPEEELADRLAAIRRRFPSREAFESRLEELGLSRDRLERLVRDELLARLFVEDRLDPRLFIDPARLRTYYETVLEPQARERGERLAPFDETSRAPRRLVEEHLVHEEMARWTAELRDEAEIELLLEPLPGEVEQP